MKGYRALELGGSAALSAVCRRIKLARAGDLHDAIADAWLAMRIYLWLHGWPLQRRLRGSLPRTPFNWRHAEIGSAGVDRPAPVRHIRHKATLSSLPRTTAEPRKDCILPEGFQEVVV